MSTNNNNTMWRDIKWVNSNIKFLAAEYVYKRGKDYNEYRQKWVDQPCYKEPGEFPLFLDIEVTSACNLACPTCVQTHANFVKGYMEWELYKKIIDEGSDNKLYGCKMHCAGRGEALLHPQLPKLITYAKKKGLIDTWLNTNGTLLNKNKAKEILDSGLDMIVFSVDSCDQKEYEVYRKGASFDKLKQNISDFIELRDMGGYNTIIRVQKIRFPGDTEQSLHRFASFWNPYADEVTYLRYKDMQNRTYGIESRYCCSQLWQRLGILWSGEVSFCNNDDREIGVLGNVKTTTIKKLWKSKELNFVRKTHENYESHLIGACDGCFYKNAEVLADMENK